MKAKNHERRGRPRVELDADVVVDVGAQRFHARARDISCSGMGLTCPSSVPVGRFVRLRLSFPGVEGLVSLNAIVVRAEGLIGGYRWGVQFDVHDRWAASSVSSFVSSRRPHAVTGGAGILQAGDVAVEVLPSASSPGKRKNRWSSEVTGAHSSAGRPTSGLQAASSGVRRVRRKVDRVMADLYRAALKEQD